MANRIRTALERHQRDEDGALTPEALVFMVVLIWAYTAMFVFWDAYKTENLVVKATYTVADMISRQTEIDADFVDGANDIFGFLSGADPTNELRVTVINMDADPLGNPEPTIVCTHATGEGSVWGGITEIEMIEDSIPITAIGDQLIVVEGISRWEPIFTVGLPGRFLYEIAVAKPRYAGEIDCSGFVS